jgi:hypothetical protein
VTDDGEGTGLGADEPDALAVDMGAALDKDEDATREAADTSFAVDGFETGAGFDLDDVSDGGGQYTEIEAMEVRSSSFDELDIAEAEASSRTASRPTLPDSVDRTIRNEFRIPDPADDVASLLLPMPAGDDAKSKARHLGLEALERGRKRRKRARFLLSVSTLFVVGGGGFAAAYLGILEIPGVTPPEWSRFAVDASAALPSPRPEAPVMSHVIFIDTWREAATPRAWADALRERMPELLGLVTPLTIDGDQQFALLVGPAYSAAEADALGVSLAVAFELLNLDPRTWAVQEAPYSFFFGEYETLEEANGRLQAPADLSVPAFALRVTYPGQAGATRVYGGAYSDEDQARGMARLLDRNNLGDVPFTELRGRLPD